MNMSGVPVGVALGRADPPCSRAGDVVEVEMTVSVGSGMCFGQP
jgi:hypothetical protein